MVEANRKAGSEPIEGYVLRERLGAGGYGEVWRCDAPGGLQKAIKFIYGGAGGKQSESELKSLRRICKVYHPFLLSIERIEDVEGQTIIITELAESSLELRLNHYLKAGATGIPRNELLEYFRDAADALDFLSNEHSLQHLDVKPGNLLIVANRIKVGDFGLVKDLNDIHQSCVSGMTPAYSAPEVFDGRPDVRSDQYSLAVTYVELLTGKLPFSGVSMAELAKQHLHAAPQLEWLPPADREVVARALFKDPTDRFLSCRQFIDQLIRAKLSRVPVQQQTEDRSEPNGTTTQQTAIGAELAPTFKPQLPPTDAPPPSASPLRRCLYIGVGGVGTEALASLKQHLEPEANQPGANHESHWLAIDTDPGNGLCSSHSDTSSSGGPFQEDEQLCLPLNSPEVYRRAPDGTFKSLSRRWLFNIPRSLRTEGIRPLALLAMTSQLAAVRRVVADKIDALLRDSESSDVETRVYLLSSLHGATGSGLLAEVGLVIQDLAQVLLPEDRNGVDVRALVSAASVSRAGPARMGPAAALAALNEMSYHMSASRVVPTLDGSTGTYSRRKPFSWVGLVDGGKLDRPADRNRAVIQLVSAALLDSHTETATALEGARSTDLEQGWLRAISVESLDVQDHLPTEQFSVFCATQVLGGALRFLQSESDVSESTASAFVESLVGVLQAPTSDEVLSPEDRVCWKARLTKANDEQCEQLSADLSELREKLLEPLRAQRITWPNVEKLINAAIERFEFLENQLAAEPYTQLLAAVSEQSEAKTLEGLSKYIARLVDELANLNQELGSLRGARFQVFNAALATLAGPLSGEVGRNLASRISRSRHARSLLSMVSAEAEKRIDELLPIDKPPQDIDCPSFVRMLADIAITAAENLPLKLVGSKSAVTESAKKLNDEFGKLIPPFIQSGGEASRLVVGDPYKLQELTQLLSLAPAGEETISTTTLVESNQYNDDTLLIHDCDKFPLPQFIRRAWRPSDETVLLAEKLRTRVDVEWPSVDSLVFEQTTTKEPEAPVAPVSTPADPWLQLNEAAPPPVSLPSMPVEGGTVEL